MQHTVWMNKFIKLGININLDVIVPQFWNHMYGLRSLVQILRRRQKRMMRVYGSGVQRVLWEHAFFSNVQLHMYMYSWRLTIFAALKCSLWWADTEVSEFLGDEAVFEKGYTCTVVQITCTVYADYV